MLKYLTLIFILIFTSLLSAGTFIITNTNDSGIGTLREAITSANDSAGPDTLLFNIPKSDLNYSSLGIWTINLHRQLPDILDDGTFIDGSSQTVFIGENMNMNGPEIEIQGNNSINIGFNILGDNFTVANLNLNRFVNTHISVWNAAGGTIAGCYIGTNATGSSTFGKAIRGITLSGSKNISIIPWENTPNIIAGHDDLNIFLVNSKHNTISGNILGLNRTKKKVLDTPETVGILLQDDADSNLVEHNYIGSPWIGITIANGSSHNRIIGNYVGTDENLELEAGASLDGIRFWNAPDNYVWNNTIGYCKNGVYVAKETSLGNIIAENSIAKNSNKGILNSEGGNNMIAAPMILSISPTQIEGNSVVGKLVEIYCDDYDQGQVFLGTATTDDAGNWTYPLSSEPPLANITALARDDNGNTSEFSTAIKVSVDDLATSQPISFRLEQNYPNPFNPTTRINFTLPKQSQVSLKVYNILGEEISTLTDRHMGTGNHNVIFDGYGFATGIYFYTITAGDFVETKKMVFVE
jgi:trimeric autotransporter adhesin